MGLEPTIFLIEGLLCASLMVRMTGLEPAASSAQTKRSSQTELHPDMVAYATWFVTPSIT